MPAGISCFMFLCTFPEIKKAMEYSSQPEFTCSKLTIETLGQGVKYVQS